MMQPSTVSHTSPPPSAIQVSATSTLWQMAAMAMPLAASAVIMPALNLGTITVLARASKVDAIETLSLLQPVFVLTIAIMEGLGTTNQVFSAKSKFNWPRHDIIKSSLRLSGFGLVLLGFVAAIGYALDQWMTFADPSVALIMRALPFFVLSQAALLIFDVYNGAMRGQSKAILSLLPFIGLAAISLGVTHFLVSQYGWGFDAVLVGNLAGPLAMLPVIALMVRNQVGASEGAPAPLFAARLRQLLFFVGGPVTASIVVGSISAAVIFPALSGFGKDYVSAFFVVLRFRIVFMIPAIAVGSVIAILVNQVTDGDEKVRSHYLMVGVPAMLALYGTLTALLPYWSAPVLELLVSRTAESAALRAATDLMMSQLQVTFFLVAGGAMLQALLEQLGRGVQMLVIAGITELVTSVVTIYAIQHGVGLKEVLQIQVVMAAGVFAVLIWQFILLLAQLRRNHVA